MNYDENEFDMNLIILLFFFVGQILWVHRVYNYIFNNQNLYENSDDDDDDVYPKTKNEIIQEEKVEKLPEIPYEDKYLINVRNMKNIYVFTDEELKIQEKKLQELQKEENQKKLESIFLLNEKIEDVTMKMNELNINGADDLKKDSNKDKSLMKNLYISLESELALNKKQLQELQDEIMKNDELNEKAQQYVIDIQLKEFKKRYIIEHTPIGNVLMFYNHDKLAFEYYSDLTIPYRYLETVARKYVLTYNYRPLYIDMEEELKEYEKKMQENSKKEDSETKTNVTNTNTNTNTKNVFAKFKSYNKEAGTGRVNIALPPKNSIPQNRLLNTVNIVKNGSNKDEKIVLKERSNRYSYQGKFSNFNILQKIDKKVVDKKYALTFAEFKKMNK
jgi:hypothetical protein